jgi:hypothetical protein
LVVATVQGVMLHVVVKAAIGDNVYDFENYLIDVTVWGRVNTFSSQELASKCIPQYYNNLGYLRWQWFWDEFNYWIDKKVTVVTETLI